jgi:hypothetical protein
MTHRVMRQKNMVINSTGPGTKNDHAIYSKNRPVSCESGDGSHSWWLTMSTGTEESPLLEAITKQ